MIDMPESGQPVLSEVLRKRLNRIRQDANGGWPASVLGKAPHKPLMLLAVIDLAEAGFVRENLIPFNERLLAAFDHYWVRCCGDRLTNPLQPFWYLKGDGFWSPVARSGSKQILDVLVDNSRIPPRRNALEIMAGATLDPELFAAMGHPAGRQALRELLIGRYFSGELQGILAAQHRIIVQAVHCEQDLRQRLDRELADLFAGDGALSEAYTEESRSLAFRNVIVESYAHRCAVCGTRIRTPGGRSAVQAAHIVPFSVCHNNDPRNGLALCPLHHWAFDQGMFMITNGFTVRLHAYAAELPADQGFLALAGRHLEMPGDVRMAPAAIALEWHGRQVFAKVG